MATKKNKVRLNLEISTAVRDNLTRLKESSGSSSVTDVIRQALALYDMVLTEYTNDGHVVLKRSDGTEERLRILF